MVDYDLTETKDGEWDIEWHGERLSVKYHINANDCEEWKKDPAGFYNRMLDDIEKDIEIWKKRENT